jgi:hypothetical protein
MRTVQGLNYLTPLADNIQGMLTLNSWPECEPGAGDRWKRQSGGVMLLFSTPRNEPLKSYLKSPAAAWRLWMRRLDDCLRHGAHTEASGYSDDLTELYQTSADV